MNESYIELMVQRKKSMALVLGQYALYVLAVVFFLSDFVLPGLFGLLGFVLAIGCGALGYFVGINAEVEYEQQLVGNGNARHFHAADPPDHDVVEHIDEIRDPVLDHNGEREQDHPAVKRPVSDQFFQHIRLRETISFVLYHKFPLLARADEKKGTGTGGIP